MMPTPKRAPYYSEPHWSDDRDEVVAFARFYWLGSLVSARELIDYFDKPWHWDNEYQGWKADDAYDGYL